MKGASCISMGGVKDFLEVNNHCETAGSIFETEKRARVPYLLYALALVAFGEIGFTGEHAAAQSQHCLIARSFALSLMLDARWTVSWRLQAEW